MATILSDKVVTARKQHRCELCGNLIEVGEKYIHVVYVDGGQECSEAVVDYGQEAGEEEWDTTSVMDLVNDKLRDDGIKPAEYVRDAVLQYINISEN